MEKRKIITPELPAGVVDRSPRDMIAWRRMMELIIGVFQRFAFEPLGTSIMHYLDVLVGEGEVGDITSNLFLPVKTGTYQGIMDAARASQDQRPLDCAQKLNATGFIRKRAKGLRYDLTVALARWVAANINDLSFPFRRWDMGPVFRADPPGHGRRREFVQCDVDILGDFSLRADAEIISVISAVLGELGFAPDFVIHLNSRRVHQGLPAYAGFDPAKLPSVLVQVDKASRDGWNAVQEMLTRPCDDSQEAGVGLSPDAVQKVLSFCQLPGDNAVKLAAAGGLFSDAEAQAGIRDLQELLELARIMDVSPSSLQVDFSLARGLGYYTGPIFETTLTKFSDLGSVFSGGRFDDLASRFCDRHIPATGASIGLDRVFLAWEKMGRVSQPSIAQIMIAVVQENLYPRYYEIAAKLRALGANVLVYSGGDMALRDQLGHAKGKGIPYVVIAGNDELQGNEVTLRDMKESQQNRMPISQLEAFAAQLAGA